MEYICSDTNVWLDFSAVGRTHLPFRLPYTYIMNSDAIEDEVLSPEGLGRELVELGLQQSSRRQMRMQDMPSPLLKMGVAIPK